MDKNALRKNLPTTPGIYLMKNAQGRVLYVGKAANLRRRVSNYFVRPHNLRIERLTLEIARIDYEKTDTAIEALILESKRIKELKPPYNIREKDDKSFLFVVITKEKFPRVLLSRGKDAISHKPQAASQYGPFTSATSIRAALRIIRKIFPFNTHPADKIGTFRRPCFDHEIGLCPGTCIGAISRTEYVKQIRNIKLLFEGKKARILSSLGREMKIAAKMMDFERAKKMKRQMFAWQHIQDIALIKEEEPVTRNEELGTRIEGYDISNISGTDAVGAMVVFLNDQPSKSEYRKFKIQTIQGANDTGMLEEVLRRRLKRIPPVGGWPLPNLFLIDGGVGQVNAARKVLKQNGLKLPVVGLAKGPERKRNDLTGKIPEGIKLETLIRVRDEAHRFAIGYHKQVRSKRFLKG